MISFCRQRTGVMLGVCCAPPPHRTRIASQVVRRGRKQFRFFCSAHPSTSAQPHPIHVVSKSENEADRKSDVVSKRDIIRSKLLLKDRLNVESFFRGSVSQSVDVSTPVTVPYVSGESQKHWGNGRKVYYESYGCQMNLNDTEIVRSLLVSSGYSEAPTVDEADVILIMTCAIREGAENKIWRRLEALKLRKIARRLQNKELLIGILGCMAERLKQRVVEREKSVDVVAGPDAYRDLPRLLAATGSGQSAVNVLLSLDETYADVTPIRVNMKHSNAFVSTMRGCDNMCTYCIVPFTRGRERSRDIDSILEEVRILSDQGIKQVTLLGQNVNSYRDTSASTSFGAAPPPTVDANASMSAGFRTVYRARHGGRRFADLLDHVSRVDPEMRVRFTAAHPKDFPVELLEVIKDRPNICNQLHLPAQHGNDNVLERMGRGYTVEAYLALIDKVKTIIPGVSFTSDFIAGFCGETEADHQDTLKLIDTVEYEMAFCYPYSMREKTKAHRRYADDVPDAMKRRRTTELLAGFDRAVRRRRARMVGHQALVFVERHVKNMDNVLVGRTEGGCKVLFSAHNNTLAEYKQPEISSQLQTGNYVALKITEFRDGSLFGEPICKIKLADYYSDFVGAVCANDRLAINV